MISQAIPPGQFIYGIGGQSGKTIRHVLLVHIHLGVLAERGLVRVGLVGPLQERGQARQLGGVELRQLLAVHVQQAAERGVVRRLHDGGGRGDRGARQHGGGGPATHGPVLQGGRWGGVMVGGGTTLDSAVDPSKLHRTLSRIW